MRSLLSKPNVDGADSDYPFGKIRDRAGATNGTPVNEEVYGDFHQFFEKLMSEAGVTPNDLPDNDYNGFQLFQAFVNNLHTAVSEDVIKGLLGSYTTNDLVILHGCVVTATIPGSSSITAGAVYYNGKIYKVPANGAIVTSGSETLVFKIDTSEEPNFVYLTNGLTGTGIADYNASTINDNFPYGPWVDLTSSLTANVASGSTFKYRTAPGNKIHVVAKIKRDLGGTGFDTIVTMPAEARPLSQKQFLVSILSLTGIETYSMFFDSSSGTGNVSFDGSDAFFGVLDHEYSLT